MIELGSAYALATAMSWSGAVILFRQSGKTIHPVGLNTFKNVLSLGLFALTLAAMGRGLPATSTHDYAWLLASGALGIGVADTLFFKSLNLLGAGRSAIVDCTYAPAVVTIAWLLLGERLGWVDAIGAAMIVGAVLLAGWPAVAEVSVRRHIGRRDAAIPRGDLVRGIGYGVASMVLMAVAIVSVKPVLERHDVLWATTVRLVGGVAAILAWVALDPSLRAGTLRAFVPQPVWRTALPASVLGSYVSMLFWVAGFKYARASVASILNQTSTVFTVLLAAAFLRERLTGPRVAAVALGFAGCVLVLL